jgi:dipicolinate synthase subunit A
MELDSIAYLNAIPTAEGAIYKAMEYTETTIHGLNVLVLGFGRCGKILADKLKGLNANVFCEARNEKDLAHIKALGYNVVELNNIEAVLNDMDVIFSTVPAKILDKERLTFVKKDSIIIDLASAPGSVDYDECVRLGINAYLELGLPAKIAPKSAAIYLKEEITKIICRGI